MPFSSDPLTQQRYDTIKNAFNSFGYSASDAEISSLLDTANEGVAGAYGGGTARATQAVSNYVNTIRQIQETNAHNPLTQVLSDEKGFFNSAQAKAADYMSQATGVPKLFGGMSPEQIDQYLAPVYEASKKDLADTEGAFARRGAAGSSTEGNALAEQNRIFRENVLSTGLGVGLRQQERAGQYGMGLYSLLPQVQGLIQGTAGTLSEQARADAATRSQLPLFLNSYAANQRSMGENEAALIMQEQAAKEAGHNSGFSWNLGSGPLSIGQNNKGATHVGLNLPMPGSSPSPTMGFPSSSPTSGLMMGSPGAPLSSLGANPLSLYGAEYGANAMSAAPLLAAAA